MFRKLNNVFRPNRDGGEGRLLPSEHDYHGACTVRLVRSTSMLAVGQRSQAATLKRSTSTVSLESTLYYYQRQEDKVWLYAQHRDCLEYLQALVALRRRYRSGLTGGDANAAGSSKKKKKKKKKKQPPPRPMKEEPTSRAKSSGHPEADEEATLRFFDAVIASCDSEARRKPYRDDGHADVDFIVASSSAEHDLHSNWALRVPRVADDSKLNAPQDSADESDSTRKNKSWSVSSRLQLQRNPIHLPKAVESALQTLRFKPALKKQ